MTTLAEFTAFEEWIEEAKIRKGTLEGAIQNSRECQRNKYHALAFLFQLDFSIERMTDELRHAKEELERNEERV